MTAGCLRPLTHDSRHLALELIDLAGQGRLPRTPRLRSELLLTAPTHHPLRRADAPVLEHRERVLALGLTRAHAHAQHGVVLGPRVRARRVVEPALAQLVVPTEHDLREALRGGVVAHRRGERALGRTALA